MKRSWACVLSAALALLSTAATSDPSPRIVTPRRVRLSWFKPSEPECLPFPVFDDSDPGLIPWNASVRAHFAGCGQCQRRGWLHDARSSR